jgi:hypothetical protein
MATMAVPQKKKGEISIRRDQMLGVLVRFKSIETGNIENISLLYSFIGRRQEAEGRRQEAGGRRQEAGGRRQEAGGRC